MGRYTFSDGDRTYSIKGKSASELIKACPDPVDGAVLIKKILSTVDPKVGDVVTFGLKDNPVVFLITREK